MLKKIRQYLSKFKENRGPVKAAAKDYLSQARLSEEMMCSIGLAMRLELAVYVRIDIGKQTHAFKISGRDNPTLQHLYDVANESWKVCLEQANEAILDDQRETGIGHIEKRGG
jgi:hypothetical protein